jgi:Zn-dependent metalloprotease
VVLGIVPPYLLARLARADADRFPIARQAAIAALEHDDRRRAARLSMTFGQDGSITAEVTRALDRTVADAQGTERLPGRPVRREGDDPVGDAAVDEAYDGLGATYALFHEVYGRASIDGLGMPLDATVHYGDRYDNAYWNGERMVFGDGDGEIFTRFTASLSVIGHELTHGITQYTADLAYAGQSGALNESVSDVFGVLVEQYARGEDAASASWLIGAGLFTADVEGDALRSMSAPGTAYDDDVLGADPQPGHMDDFVTTSEDNGGVHINSGIPNRAFYLAATAIGGSAWEGAGRIWFDTLGGGLSPATDFSAFASATMESADRRFGAGSSESDAVAAAWEEVGVR